jgi:hypothetical protein
MLSLCPKQAASPTGERCCQISFTFDLHIHPALAAVALLNTAMAGTAAPSRQTADSVRVQHVSPAVCCTG